MELSKRVLEMQESPVRKLVPIATKVKKEGKKVFHLNIGQPDIETPKVFMEAINHYDTKVINYSFSQGEPILIDSIRGFFAKDDILFDEDDILITNGGSEAITFCAIAVCDPGDDILVPEPFYTNYNGFTGEVNVNIIPITTKASEGFHLPTKEEIVRLITPKTKAILFSNPGNPTGTMLDRFAMGALIDAASAQKASFISDEIYHGIEYEAKAVTALELTDECYVINSFSKYFWYFFIM